MGFPILDFDEDQGALINPAKGQLSPVPQHCVLSFYQKATEKLVADGQLKRLDQSIAGETGELNLYTLEVGPTPVLVCYPPGAGGPLAAMVLETLIGMGVKTVLVCGHGGVLRKDLLRDRIMVVRSAIRQEGVSYHYLPPSDEVEVDEELVERVDQELRKHGVTPLVGKTWTTDALYRETKGLVAKRKEQGAITVEMECASLLAVAQFRHIRLAQLVCAGDDVSGEIWDPRYVSDKRSIREKLILLSAEVCAAL